MASGIRRRPRSTMALHVTPLVHTFTKRSAPLYRLGVRWSAAEGALGAAATLVAVAFALSHARALAGRPAPPRAGLDDLPGDVRDRLRRALWWGAATGWSPAASGCSSSSGRSSTCRGWRSARSTCWAARRLGDRHRRRSRPVLGLRAGVMAVAPLTGAVPADGLPRAATCSSRCPACSPRWVPASAALVVIGGAVLSAWRLWRGHRTPRAGVSARRLALGNLLIAARDARPLGERHARRAARASSRASRSPC